MRYAPVYLPCVMCCGGWGAECRVRAAQGPIVDLPPMAGEGKPRKVVAPLELKKGCGYRVCMGVHVATHTHACQHTPERPFGSQAVLSANLRLSAGISRASGGCPWLGAAWRSTFFGTTR
jgi:hypothetical protein